MVSYRSVVFNVIIMDPAKKHKLKQSKLNDSFKKQCTNAAETKTRERNEQTECNTGWLFVNRECNKWLSLIVYLYLLMLA